MLRHLSQPKDTRHNVTRRLELEIGISTWSMGNPLEALRRIAEAGFSHLEVWCDPHDVLDGCENELVLAIKDYDLKACSLHAPFTSLDISSTDIKLRKHSYHEDCGKA